MSVARIPATPKGLWAAQKNQRRRYSRLLDWTNWNSIADEKCRARHSRLRALACQIDKERAGHCGSDHDDRYAPKRNRGRIQNWKIDSAHRRNLQRRGNDSAGNASDCLCSGQYLAGRDEPQGRGYRARDDAGVYHQRCGNRIESAHALKIAVAQSFNRITVDGDMSTNDSVIMLANGLAGNKNIECPTSNIERFKTLSISSPSSSRR
jgi:hypothetical protein